MDVSSIANKNGTRSETIRVVQVETIVYEKKMEVDEARFELAAFTMPM